MKYKYCATVLDADLELQYQIIFETTQRDLFFRWLDANNTRLALVGLNLVENHYELSTIMKEINIQANPDMNFGVN